MGKYDNGEEKEYLLIQWEYKNGRTYVKPTWEPSETIEEDAPRAFNEYFDNQTTDEDIDSDQSGQFQRNSDNSVDSEALVEAPAVDGPVDGEIENESDDATESDEEQETHESDPIIDESEPIIEAPSPVKRSRKRKAKQAPEPTVSSKIAKKMPVTKKSKQK